MKKRKIIALLIAVSLMAATFVGCGGKGQENSTQSGTGSESSSGNGSTEEEPKFTVSFDTDGGSVLKSVTVEKWGTVERPEDPEKNGYIFAGWFKDDVLFDFSTRITSNVVLKAQWRKFGIDYDLHKNDPLSLVGIFDGAIQKAVLDNKEITADIEGGLISYEKAASYGLGVHTMSVKTTEKTYTLELTVASYVISDTASFLDYYEEVKNTKVSQKGEKVEKELYVVVAEDFTYTGDPINVWPAFNEGYMNGVQVGIFDGRGHFIEGLKTLDYTLFSVIQGTIKNVAFVNFEAQGTFKHGVLARFIWDGRLENVYVSGTAKNGISDIIAGGMTYDGNAPVIRNCVFNVDFGSSQGAVLYNSGKGEETQTTVENVYAISGMKTSLVKDDGGWEVFPYADVEFFGFIEMYMQDSLFSGKDEHLYFNQKMLF